MQAVRYTSSLARSPVIIQRYSVTRRFLDDIVSVCGSIWTGVLGTSLVGHRMIGSLKSQDWTLTDSPGWTLQD